MTTAYEEGTNACFLMPGMNTRMINASMAMRHLETGQTDVRKNVAYTFN